jgi:hypothetical protein
MESKMSIETISFELPSHWASAFLYGDESGLDDSDEDTGALNRFTKYMVKNYGSCHCVIVEGEGFGDFRDYHDATDFGALASDVLTFVFDVTKESNNA